jgi:LSD1 subclass zinc finger protein
MAVNLKCPNLKCRNLLKVPDKSRGQRVRCSYCNTILLVPDHTKTRQLKKALKPSSTHNKD